MENMELIICNTAADFEVAKQITTDYMKWLEMDLSFQNLEKEFAEFHWMYAAPEGGYIYIKKEDQLIGGVAFRKLDQDTCEMKRLFVYPTFQGQGFGKLLSGEIIALAKTCGYKKMRLDTIEKLDKAITIYTMLGFYPIPQYRENPDATAKFMELDLVNFTS